MITDSDIAKLKEVFATKEDLDHQTGIISRYKQETLLEMHRIRTGLESKMHNLEANLLSELQNTRKHVTAITPGYGDRLEEHHQRLKVVEDACGVQSDFDV